MYKLREACIIHSAEDYAISVFFQTFMKWTGVAFYDFVINTEDESLNSVIESKNNRFDFILFIGDEKEKWKNRYGKQTDKCVDVPDGDVVLGKTVLKDVWGDVCSQFDSGNELKKVFDALVDIYCEKDVFRKIVNGQYLFFEDYDNWEKQYEEWHEIIDRLNDIKDTAGDASKGLEYLKYATVYSCKKVNECCLMMDERFDYKTLSLINQIETAYKHDSDFYMFENLKAEVASLSHEYQPSVIPYIKNCTDRCKTDVCSSMYYYRLGQQYGLLERSNFAANLYGISYEMDAANYRALFKLAVNEIMSKNWVKAEDYIEKLIKSLGLNPLSTYDSKVCLLPPLELEYVYKCYVLLGSLEEKGYKDTQNAKYFYGKANDVRKSVPDNTFLKRLYPKKDEYEKVSEELMERLPEHMAN